MALHEDVEDRVAKKRAADYAKQDTALRAEAVRSLLRSSAGRRYLYWLLEIGRAIGENPFTGTAETTFFSCGEQNVGQQIMGHLLEVEPQGFLALLTERAEERIETKEED